MLAGDVAWIVPVAVSAHALSGSVGELEAFAYAAEGDGPTVRAQVLDIREGVDSVTATPRRQLFIAAPAIGAKIDIWLHIDRTSATGTMQVELESAATQTGGATIVRTMTDITGSGLYRFSFTIPDPPITHRWWFLELIPAGGGVYDIAAAVLVS